MTDYIYEIKRWPRRLWCRCKIMWHWLPVIWNDYDWDYAYILEAIRHKINRTKIQIEAENFHVGVDKHVRQMKNMIDLLDRHLGKKEVNRSRDLCSCGNIEFKDDGTSDLHICDWCKVCGFKQRNDSEEAEYDFMMDYLKKHMRKWWS